MEKNPCESAGRVVVPPLQRNYDEATVRALAVVRGQSPEQLEWLGAHRDGEHWALPVLDGQLTVDLDRGNVLACSGREAASWRILTLHYLGVSGRPASEAPAVTFADLPGGRAYDPVYQQRVIERLCRTVGRTREPLLGAGKALGGRPVQIGDVGFDFQAYPRVVLRLVWYAGDEELGPSGALLLPANIESFFCIEDIVVLSERLVSRLSGGTF